MILFRKKEILNERFKNEENEPFNFGSQKSKPIKSYNILDNFKDITNKHDEYAYYIEQLFHRNIMIGISEDRFNPDGSLTKAEFTALLVKSFDLEQGQKVRHSFEDVKKDAWYDRVVGIASNTGIISGRTVEIFDPQSSITNQEMAILLTKTAEIKKGMNIDVDTLSTNITDSSTVNDWAKFGVNFAITNELMDLDAQKMFNPTDKVKRFIASKALYKILELD